MSILLKSGIALTEYVCEYGHELYLPKDKAWQSEIKCRRDNCNGVARPNGSARIGIIEELKEDNLCRQ